MVWRWCGGGMAARGSTPLKSLQPLQYRRCAVMHSSTRTTRGNMNCNPPPSFFILFFRIYETRVNIRFS